MKKNGDTTMTGAAAGRRGGRAVRDKHGHQFYEEIGRQGGHKVRDLIAAGRLALKEGLVTVREGKAQLTPAGGRRAVGK